MNRSPGGENYLNGVSHRLSQSLMLPVGSDRNKVDEIKLTIKIQKDACGYGMKVFLFCCCLFIFIIICHFSFFFFFIILLYYYWINYLF